MFIFHIYNCFDTEGPCNDKGDFFSTETLISFNSGKIEMEKIVLQLSFHHEKPVCSRLKCNNVIA